MNEICESDERGFAEGFAKAYARTPLPRPAARARIDAAWRAAPAPSRAWTFAWLEPRAFTVRPAAVFAAAAVLVVAGALVGALVASRVAAPGRESGMAVTPRDDVKVVATPNAQTHAVRFVYVAPASRVTVVGDFNGWDEGATPMAREGADGTWTATVDLTDGWHAYAFVVDGQWQPDPQAPLAPADDYGSRRSVVVVGADGT